MNKKLEEDKKQINKMLVNIYDGLEFEDDEEIRELYLKQEHALKTALNCIDNSISTEVIKKKIEELKPITDKYDKQRENDEETDLSYEEASRYAAKLEVLQELLEEK